MRFFIYYMGGSKKNKLLKIFIFIQIMLAAITINLTLGAIQFSDQFSSITDNHTKDTNVIIVPTVDQDDVKYITSFYKKARIEINKLPGVDSVGDIVRGGISNRKMNFHCNMFSYSNSIFKLANAKMIKGNMTDIGYHDGINHVFVPDDTGLEFGKVYSMSFYDFYNNFKIKIKVTGVFDKNSKLLNVQYGGSSMTIASLYAKQHNMVIGSEVKDIKGNEVGNHDNPNSIAILKSGVTLDSVRPIWDKKVSSYLNYMTFGEWINAEKDSNFEVAKVQISLAIILLLMCLVGIGSGAIIKMLNESKEYGIYFMCGQVWIKSIMVNALSNILNILLPFILGTSIAKILVTNEYTRSSINLRNIFISLIIVLSIFIITGAWSVIYLIRTQPISFLRRNAS